LFEGDRVVTRSNGSAKVAANGCEKTLKVTTSIVVNSELCTTLPIQLVGVDPLAPAGSTPAIGATALVLPGLLASGATASALTGSETKTTASP
jgi:hypothetical protein